MSKGRGSKMKEPKWTKEHKVEFKMNPRIGPILILDSKKMKIGFAFCHRRKACSSAHTKKLLKSARV